VFESSGFAPLESDYLRWWMHSGQRVLFDQGADRSSSPPVAASTSGAQQGSSSQAAAGQSGTTEGPREEGGQVALVIRGITPTGYLLAEDESGRWWELTPDGNRLDMMAGLIRRRQ
jgi:biotin--protein ligase